VRPDDALRRRLVSIPLYLAALTLALATAPLWIPAAALVDLARRRRAVALRTLVLITWYLVCEALGLAAVAALWLARPLARWDAERWRELHFRLQNWWGATLFRGIVRCFSLRLEVEGAQAARLGEGPYLLLVRHASSGDTLLALELIGRAYRMRLRYVLKRELLSDPCLDLAGNRLPHVFVDRFSEHPEHEIAHIRELARGLGPRDGVVIYPEGTRFSEAKRARVLARFARLGEAEWLAYAQGLRRVLPPHPGGVLGLLEAAPGADVVVCMHTGFEGAASLGQLWRGDLLGSRVRVRFLRIARAQVPESGDARIAWLRALWQQVDAWVAGEAEAKPAS
jgi:1-acyl-sn-glycerol-3-phosphate acyltransferase